MAGTNGEALISTTGSLWTGAAPALGEMTQSHGCYVPLKAVEKISIGITYACRSFLVKSWAATLVFESMSFIVLG